MRRSCGAFLAAVVLLAAGPPAVRPFDGCPAVCSCKWKGGRRTVECADRALITVPTGVDSDTQVLDLSGNNLQILPNETFARAGLTNLQKAFLRNCRIGQIDETAFRGLTNLVELDLSNNLLTSVPSYVFRDIPYLRDLSVAKNPIQKIGARAFADCPGVVKVDASHCGLQSVAVAAFDGVARLETLRVNGNRLTELSAPLLESLTRLRAVELHDNPWVCDCHLRPMKLWLSGNNVPYSQPAVCAGGPERLSGKSVAELDVEDFDCRPDVRAESRYVEAVEGQNVTVRCRLEPGSTAHVAWYANGRRLQGAGTAAVGYPGASTVNPRVFVADGADDGGGRRSEMTVTDVRREDAGQYSCLAENRAGSAEANFTVYVAERPSVIDITLGSAHVNGVAAAMAALIVFILVLIAVTVVRIRRTTGYPADAKPAAARAAPGNPGNGVVKRGRDAATSAAQPANGGGGGYATGVGKTNPALDLSSVIERNYDPDLECRPVLTPGGSSYHVAGLDLIHDHDASRLEMCDSPMSSTAKPPPSYYSGRATAGSVARPYDDRTPIIGSAAGDAYSVGTGSDEVFSYSGQQPSSHYNYGGGQQHRLGAESVVGDYPADYGLPIIPPGHHHHHHHQSTGNVSQQHHQQQQYPQRHYNGGLPEVDAVASQQQQQPSAAAAKTLQRVWQRGVPVLPATPSLQRFANRASPNAPGTDV